MTRCWWSAHDAAGGHVHLYAIAAAGSARLVAIPSKSAATRLMAASRNVLPRLFAEFDELRARTRAVPVLGMVS